MRLVTSRLREGRVSDDAPSVEVCRWWMRNHTCMPRNWRPIKELYDKEVSQNGQDKDSEGRR